MTSIRLIKLDSALISANEENYNSNFHTEAEAPGQPILSETPQSFKRWLPLIARSQNIPHDRIQTITITKPQAQLILDAAQSSLHTREPNRLYAEELAELASNFNSLVIPPEGLFLRLDACSPKDGLRGINPLRTGEEIVLRLTTSHRATNSILRCLERGDGDVELFFLPFDGSMRTDREYRVFCAPEEGMITGVSQYRWHKANFFAGSPEEIERLMRVLFEGIRVVHAGIMDEVEGGAGGEMDRLLLEQGFTFDVMFDEESGKCRLIELNSFGARSGCGSCLFHWLKDWDVLYGTDRGEGEGAELEFRISI